MAELSATELFRSLVIQPIVDKLSWFRLFKNNTADKHKNIFIFNTYNLFTDLEILLAKKYKNFNLNIILSDNINNNINNYFNLVIIYLFNKEFDYREILRTAYQQLADNGIIFFVTLESIIINQQHTLKFDVNKLIKQCLDLEYSNLVLEREKYCLNYSNYSTLLADLKTWHLQDSLAIYPAELTIENLVNFNIEFSFLFAHGWKSSIQHSIYNKKINRLKIIK